MILEWKYLVLLTLRPSFGQVIIEYLYGYLIVLLVHMSYGWKEVGVLLEDVHQVLTFLNIVLYHFIQVLAKGLNQIVLKSPQYLHLLHFNPLNFANLKHLFLDEPEAVDIQQFDVIIVLFQVLFILLGFEDLFLILYAMRMYADWFDVHGCLGIMMSWCEKRKDVYRSVVKI